MRTAIALGALLVAALLPATAHADVAPAPACPKGQHSEYLYGYHCVDDGFHMERDDKGNPTKARNKPRPTPSASASASSSATASPATTSAASTFASAPPSATQASTAAPATSSSPPATEPPASTPPGPRGCACVTANGNDDSGVGVGIALMLAASMLLRRRNCGGEACSCPQR